MYSMLLPPVQCNAVLSIRVAKRESSQSLGDIFCRCQQHKGLRRYSSYGKGVKASYSSSVVLSSWSVRPGPHEGRQGIQAPFMAQTAFIYLPEPMMLYRWHLPRTETSLARMAKGTFLKGPCAGEDVCAGWGPCCPGWENGQGTSTVMRDRSWDDRDVHSPTLQSQIVTEPCSTVLRYRHTLELAARLLACDFPARHHPTGQGSDSGPHRHVELTDDASC